MIRAKCHKISTEFLLDSGASLNIISSQFLARVPRKYVEKLSNKNIIIHGVGDYQTKVQDHVRITFQINDTKFTDEFYVIPNNFNILGSTFLRKNKAIMNFDSSEVTLNGVVYKMHCPSVRSSLVKTVNDVTIAAFTIQEIRVKLSKPVLTDNVFVTGLNSIETRYPGLSVAPAVVNSQFTLSRLVNESDTPIAIPANSAIAIGRTISSHVITQMEDFYEQCDSDIVAENAWHENPASPNQTPQQCCENHACETSSETSPLQPAGSASSHQESSEPKLASTLIQQPQQRAVPEIAQQGQTPDSTTHAQTSQLLADPHAQSNVYISGAETGAETNMTTKVSNKILQVSGEQLGQLPNIGNVDTVTQSQQGRDTSANVVNLNSGSYYKCEQNNLKQKRSKILPPSPPCDQTINDDDEPFDNVLKFNIKNDNFVPAEIKDFENFLLKNDKRFATSRAHLGENDEDQHLVDTGDNNPSSMRKCRYYRLTPIMQDVMDREIHSLLKYGMIEPSTSNWRSPALLVKKPNGDFRLVVNYKQLNKLVKPQHFPLITAEELWTEMGNQRPRIFTTLDFFSGYHQILLEEDSRDKTTFVVRSGSYRWRRMPMGLANSPATFGKAMNRIFGDMLFKNMCFYADDLLRWSDCIECHKKHLQEVFDRLEKANMTLKASKCQFAMPRVKYLGHYLSENGVEVNPEKTELITNYKVPTNPKQVRQFLGLTQYFRRFQKNYSKTAYPLQQLTRKDVPFIWTEDCQKAFDTLRNNLVKPPILAYPNMSHSFIVTTDASDTGLGYILSQEINGEERVIQFSGRALRPAEKNYSVSEREALSVVSAFKCFHYYLYNSHTTVRTDHTAVKYIKQQDHTRPKGRIARWMLDLQGYDFDIEYKPGKANTAADALSRLPEYPPSTENQPHISGAPIVLTAQTSDMPHAFDNVNDNVQCDEPQLERFDWLEAHFIQDETMPSWNTCFEITDIDLAMEQQNCPEVGPMYQFIKSGIVPPGDELTRADIASADQYAIRDDILIHFFQPRLRHKDKFNPLITQIVVPKKFRSRILKEYHESLAAGCHQGSDRLFQAIRQKYYWKRQYTDIQEYQKTCVKCQKASHYHPPKQPLHPLEVPRLFERLHIDYIGPLRTSICGKKWILLVMDAFSGWCEAFALPSADAITTAQALYEHIISRQGCFKSLLSDRGATFLSTLLRALCDIFGIRQLHTSSYHAASNAKCERFNRFLLKSLRTMVDQNQLDWPKFIPAIMMAYRATPANHSTEFSPFFLSHCKDMILPIDNVLNPTVDVSPNYRETLKYFIESVKLTRQIAHDNLVRHQQESKQYYDRNTKDPEYRLGDYVWLFDPTTKVGFSKKLKARYVGPYIICEIGKNHTYRLRHYYTRLVTDTFINAQRIKPAYLPWESRIRRQDRERDRMNDPNRLNDQGTDSTLSQGQKQGQNQGQGSVGSQTNKETASAKHDQGPTEVQQEVDEVVDLKKQNNKKYFRVKFKGNPQVSPWYKEGYLKIPQNLIDKCLQHRTWSGQRRKKKKW